MKVGESGILVGVQEDSSIFLKYLDKISLNLGTIIEIAESFEYDGSMRIRINQQTEQVISPKVSQNLFIKRKT
jgi:DtxR family Mn-dependent transcriptional regulator